jgi:hypothetical protein
VWRQYSTATTRFQIPTSTATMRSRTLSQACCRCHCHWRCFYLFVHSLTVFLCVFPSRLVVCPHAHARALPAFSLSLILQACCTASWGRCRSLQSRSPPRVPSSRARRCLTRTLAAVPREAHRPPGPPPARARRPSLARALAPLPVLRCLPRCPRRRRPRGRACTLAPRRCWRWCRRPACRRRASGTTDCCSTSCRLPTSACAASCCCHCRCHRRCVAVVSSSSSLLLLLLLLSSRRMMLCVCAGCCCRSCCPSSRGCVACTTRRRQ